MKDSHWPFIPETFIFLEAMSLSIILLLPIVPISIEPLAGYCNFSLIEGLAPETF